MAKNELNESIDVRCFLSSELAMCVKKKIKAPLKHRNTPAQMIRQRINLICHWWHTNSHVFTMIRD